ncbi:calcium-binding protein [Planktotalea sp.]|uniref:calcium-binding protein n=1 Tax=Planktotalea sp. TaxID=2029877 RepID=UPI003D6A223A
MATRSFTLNNGDIFTLSYHSAGYGFGEIEFKVADADGTDHFALQDMRTTAVGENEAFGGATVLSNGNLRVFVAVENGATDMRYIDYNINTGAQIGVETLAPITLNDASGNFVQEIPANLWDNANAFLTLDDGSIAYGARYGVTFVYDQDGVILGYGGDHNGQASALVEVGGKILKVVSTQNPVPGVFPHEGVTLGQFLEIDPSSPHLIADPTFQLSENYHVMQTSLGLGFNSVTATELGDGRIAIAYSDFPFAGGVYLDHQAVYLKIINPDGTTDVAEYLASTNCSDGNTVRPEIFALQDGGFALAFNTTYSLPTVARTEVRVYDENGVEQDSFTLATAPSPEELYVSPDGEVWLYADEGTSSLHQFAIEGGDMGLTEVGTAAAETMNGSAFDDDLSGKGGNDTLNGNDGADTLSGGKGMDTLNGGKGDDNLDGDKGDDVLQGGKGHDILKGGRGFDFLFGGKGDDTLKGEKGADVLNGGKGNDQLFGGNGTDTFVFAGADGSDTITGFEDGLDLIQITDPGAQFSDVTISQVGSDVQIDYDSTTILVENRQAGDFSETDFVFGVA